MATPKTQVTRLNNESPVFRRLGPDASYGLGDILDALITTVNRMATGSVNGFAAPTLATTKSKVKTAAAVSYSINGIPYALAISDNFWTLTGANLADGYTRKYLLLVDAAGTATVLASDDQLTASAALCAFPTVPATKVVIGMLQVDTAAAVFIPGTTLLDAATVTDTYTSAPIAGVDTVTGLAGAIPVLV